jgi:hypothetical protein
MKAGDGPFKKFWRAWTGLAKAQASSGWGLAKRFGRWLRKVWVWPAGAAGVLTVIAVLGSAVLYLGKAANEQFDWRDDEYGKLHSLAAGFDLAYFKSVLGTPIFSRARKTGYTESSFRGRGYWVQALSYGNIVKLYAVTACEGDFEPTFTIPGLDIDIGLNQDKLADVDSIPEATNLDYRYSGATASTWLYETTGGGNPGYYKSYLWGINDACPDWYSQFTDIYKAVPFPGVQRMASDLGPQLRELRNEGVVNTYAETAPKVDLVPFVMGGDRTPEFAFFHGFHIGVDRLLVRTTQ